MQGSDVEVTAAAAKKLRSYTRVRLELRVPNMHAKLHSMHVWDHACCWSHSAAHIGSISQSTSSGMQQDADPDSVELLLQLTCETSGLFDTTAAVRRVRTM